MQKPILEDEKKCVKCEEVKTKLEFYVDRRSPDGRQCKCKRCEKEYNIANFERKSAYAKGYRDSHKEDHAVYKKEYNMTYRKDEEGLALTRANRQRWNNSSDGKLSISRSSRKSKAEHPDKTKARDAFNGAVRYGRIIRPDECSECYDKCRPEGHHWSYAKEHWLDVVWLCRGCHVAEHNKIKLEKHEEDF